MPEVGASPAIEVLAGPEVEQIRPLLLDLLVEEQGHYPHRQLSRDEMERELVGPLRPAFEGENMVFAVRDGGEVVAFCWCVLFDPGTGLEAEIAEVYVAEPHRGRGLARALLRRAVALFHERGVTLGVVWTRADNPGAVRLYESAGFSPTTQLVLTWLPDGA